MTKIKRTDNTKCLQESRKSGTPAFLSGVSIAITTWEVCLATYMKLNTHLPYIPAILLLTTYTREMHAYAHQKTYIRIFAAAPFLVALTGKHPK